MKKRTMAYLLPLFLGACQATGTDQDSGKLSYYDIPPETRNITEKMTKCALAMAVANPEDYSSINEVFFNNGDTYGDLMSPVTESAQKKFLDSVALRAQKYANLHYDGNIAPVMLEYVLSNDCNVLYFSDNFNEKYADLIKGLNQIKTQN